MSTKTLCNALNRFKGTYTNIRYSDYFESEVINTTINNNQFDVFIKHEASNGTLLVKIVTLGVNYKVSKLKAFESYKHLNSYMKALQTTKLH